MSLASRSAGRLGLGGDEELARSDTASPAPAAPVPHSPFWFLHHRPCAGGARGAWDGCTARLRCFAEPGLVPPPRLSLSHFATLSLRDSAMCQGVSSRHVPGPIQLFVVVAIFSSSMQYPIPLLPQLDNVP